MDPSPKEPMRIGRYEILRRLGSGGMGEIFLAVQKGLDRRVALKVLPRQVAEEPEFVQRFQREVQILAGLAHPHICPVIESGEEDGLHYYAMEYLAGKDLEEVVQTQRIDFKRAAEIARQVAARRHR